MEIWSNYKKNKYKKWKASIEEGTFIIINDNDYEEFSNIYKDENDEKDITNDVSDSSCNTYIEPIIDICDNEDNILENTRSKYYKHLGEQLFYTFISIFPLFFVIIFINFGHNTSNAHIQNIPHSNYYENNEIEWLLL